MVGITIFDMVEGQQLIEHALMNNKNGEFVIHFNDPNALFLQYMAKGLIDEALPLIPQLSLNYHAMIHTPEGLEPLIDILIKYNVTNHNLDILKKNYHQVLRQQGVSIEIWETVQLLQNLHPQQALDYLIAHNHMVNIFDEYHNKRILDYAKESMDDSVFVQYFSDPTHLLLQYVASGKKMQPPHSIDESLILYTTDGLYQIEGIPFGQGGWGDVHRAHYYKMQNGQVNKSDPLAIKVLSLGKATENEYNCLKDAYPQHFFEQFNQDNIAYLVMTLFSGVPLDSYLLNFSELLLSERYHIASELLAELMKIHQQQVTHHDAKPKNI